MKRVSDIQGGLKVVATDVHTILDKKVTSANMSMNTAIEREKSDRNGEGPMSEFTERIFKGGNGPLVRGSVPTFRTALQ